MKYLFVFTSIALLPACGLFGGGVSPTPSGSPKPAKELGDCKPCPYDWYDAAGNQHTCSAPGCHCIDDNQNHSDPSKCLKQ